MNNEPINHLQKVLGRLESRGHVDLVKMEKKRGGESGGVAIMLVRQRGFSGAEAPSPSI